MQAMNRFIELEMPDLKKGEGKIIVLDASGLFGPIGKVLSIGGKVDLETPLEIGDWVAFRVDMILNLEIKGVVRTFIFDDGVVSKLTNEEVDKPVIPIPVILTPKDAIEKVN